MSLRTDIQKIRTRSLISLDAAHDYFTYTKQAWNTVRLDIQMGGRLVWQNRHTHSFISERDIVVRAKAYVIDQLPSSTLQQFVSIFEGFLFDAIGRWLQQYPKSLSEKQIAVKEILSLPDKETIVQKLIQKELQDIFYDRPADWFAYIQNRVNIAVPTADQVDQFAEVKATRDALVHGQGIANEFYLAKAGRFARARLGEPLELPEPYHQQSWELIRTITSDIGAKMADKANSRPQTIQP